VIDKHLVAIEDVDHHLRYQGEIATVATAAS
jgi:hypothetical protein